ncbi:hypothetical protein [Corallococcus carmarthensis]|uniref:Lipoprotein n=1 Tax=Corallococcus carmarthensis TaxID=2316728 RepID=A0A3A8K396_9BACT|nr:hypothetical protein [Corallococcus carmarthensis]NOK17170.1 hypothetical protein [Corallococcus carmarthensis]RKH01976.1 hypothetical protein D7X32_18480 [Corallococcus carmarthensis]
MRTPVLLSAIALLGLSACGGADFDAQSEIRSVRVLGIKAEPPELALDPNASTLPPPVTFTALAVTPDARPVTVTYALCRPDVNPYGDVACPGDSGVALNNGVLSLSDPAVQALLIESFQQATGSTGGGDGGTFDFNDPAVQEVLRVGLPLFVGYEATDGSGTPEGVERGVRRITLRSTDAPNQNPVMQDVLWNDAPLVGPLPLDAEVTFTPVLGEGSEESYSTADGTRTEQVFYSWFVTGEGEVGAFRSLEPVDGKPGDPTTTYTTAATPERITVWVVARDGRGGTDWTTRTVDVGP